MSLHESELHALPPIEENEVHPTLTVGDIIARLSNMPMEMPVIGYFISKMSDRDTVDDWPGFDSWVNLTDLHWDPSYGDAAVIEVRDTYDSRQW